MCCWIIVVSLCSQVLRKALETAKRDDNCFDSVPTQCIAGAVLVAAGSVLLSWPLACIQSLSVRRVCVMLIPLILSCCLYWTPVWFGESQCNYPGWEIPCIGLWTIIGAIHSEGVVLLVLLIRWKRELDTLHVGHG